MSDTTPSLRTDGLGKEFGAVTALDVGFAVGAIVLAGVMVRRTS